MDPLNFLKKSHFILLLHKEEREGERVGGGDGWVEMLKQPSIKQIRKMYPLSSLIRCPSGTGFIPNIQLFPVINAALCLYSQSENKNIKHNHIYKTKYKGYPTLGPTRS